MELAGPQPELVTETWKADPLLTGFARLGHEIFFYEPPSTQPETEGSSTSSTSSSSSSPPPDLLLLCSWMGASSKNVMKYLKTYQTIFPSTPILLLKQDGGDLFWRTKASQIQSFKPALAIVKRFVDAHKPNNPRVLVHIFSNGGSYKVSMFSEAYKSSTGGDLLPISALILDSTPSLPDNSRAHEAISESLPKTQPLRILGQTAFWAFAGFEKAMTFITQKEDITTWLRRMLNDPTGAFTQDGVKRLYLYSQADRLIPAAHVEAHSQDAIQIIGPERVQMEDFGDTRHVGHVIGDPTRYWSLVQGLWAETVG